MPSRILGGEVVEVLFMVYPRPVIVEGDHLLGTWVSDIGLKKMLLFKCLAFLLFFYGEGRASAHKQCRIFCHGGGGALCALKCSRKK